MTRTNTSVSAYAYVALLATALPANSASAGDASQANVRTTSDGLALSAGIGTQYSFVGAQAEYFHQLADGLFRVAGYASLGYAGPFELGRTTKLGYCFGAVLSWGDKHRALLDTSYGAVGFASETFVDAHRDKVFHGPALQLGYEYMAYGGLFFRVELGVSIFVDRGSWQLESRFGPAVTLGLGWKLW